MRMMAHPMANLPLFGKTSLYHVLKSTIIRELHRVSLLWSFEVAQIITRVKFKFFLPQLFTLRHEGSRLDIFNVFDVLSHRKKAYDNGIVIGACFGSI